jgi:CubicO group peptidase (beta-lactamase class C family)
MTDKVLEEQLADICNAAIANNVFPGCSLGYLRSGRKILLNYGNLRYGVKNSVTTNTIYDAASVTKSIPTACVMLSLIEQGRASLDDQVITFIPELDNEFRNDILIRHLLTYTVIFDVPGGFGKLAQEHPDDVLRRLFRSPLKAAPGSSYYYTNPPALLVGLICERITGKRLDEIANEMFFEPLGMTNTSFLAQGHHHGVFAPSEIDWRGEVKGQVHDESAWILAKSGLVTGHAGLFTSATDLLKFAAMLLAGGTYQGRTYFKPETVALMHTNQLGGLGLSAGLGWQLAAPTFMGTHVSNQAFGKTGFRSCMVVIDPVKDIALAHLANGNYPHRPASDEGIIRVRQAISDAILGS